MPTSEDIPRLLLKFAVLTGAWLVLCAGDFGSLLVGGPAIAVAVFVGESSRDTHGGALRPLRLLSFVPFFLKESLRGGIDAAARVIPASPRLHCGVIAFDTSLPPEAARIFFANVIGLLPGTLTTMLSEDSLLVHTLDTTRPTQQELLLLEGRVAHLFGISDSE